MYKDVVFSLIPFCSRVAKATKFPMTPAKHTMVIQYLLITSSSVSSSVMIFDSGDQRRQISVHSSSQRRGLSKYNYRILLDIELHFLLSHFIHSIWSTYHNNSAIETIPVTGHSHCDKSLVPSDITREKADNMEVVDLRQFLHHRSLATILLLSK